MTRSTQQATRVLFVGNSFTARNDLPELIGELAAARGITMDYELLSMGGASLRMHWNKGSARNAIQTGKFDYVVLQEQSTLPIKSAARMRENILLFNDEIRAAGAKTVLYMTWARKHSPENQAAISKAYESIGNEIGALVVPVGNAWKRFMEKHESPALHDKDQSHPTLAGSYLAACVFLGTLFDKSAVGIEFKVKALSAEDIHNLQQVASE